jgi:tetratricopeptide (TPR) repeat protein
MNRLKRLIVEAHQRSLWQALVIYLGASYAVLEAVQLFRDEFGLPDWLLPVALILLLIGLPVVIVTSLAREEVYGDDVSEEHGAAAAEEDRRLRLLTWRTAGLSFVGALALWGVVAAGLLLISPPGEGVEEAFADAGPGIAVLPFSVHGEGLEVWREGMVDLLSTGMNGVGGLRAVDTGALLARWREEVPETGEADRATAINVARSSGARYALLGSAVVIGQEVRLSAEIYDTEAGAQMGTVLPVEGSLDNVLALVDRLAVQSLVVLLEQEASELPIVDLASVTTASIPALRAFLEAEALSRRSNYDAAIAAYERAVDFDSTFALAFYRLSQAYMMSEGMGSGRRRENLEQAMRWVERLPPREGALVRAVHATTRRSLREAHELLQRLVRSYPDYRMARYELCDLYYHAGHEIPVSLEDARRCFERAAQLDPRFAGHLVHLAFLIDPDSTRAAAAIAEYRFYREQGYPATDLALDLAFGDQEHRERAFASLDTLDFDILWRLPLSYFPRPRFWPQWKAVLLEVERRGDTIYTDRLFWGAAGGRGYLKQAFEFLDRPQASTYDRACLPVHAHMNGFPMPPERLEGAATVLSQIDSTSEPTLLYCAALYAADQGRWAEHARAVELSWGHWRREVDAQRRRSAKSDALAVEAYGLWRRGDPEAALEKLEEVRRYQARPLVRMVLAFAFMDLERWEEAVPYLRAWWWWPYSHMNYHLARAYEAMGENEKAAKEYAFFIEAWADADPELQLWVEDARRALERLAPDR